jgi:hypothetical protein
MDYRNKQQELWEVLLKTGLANEPVDTKERRKIVASPMDPFTFFAYIQSETNNDKRALRIAALKIAIGLESDVPTDFNGLPTAMRQTRRYYDADAPNVTEQVDFLWNLAEHSIEGKLTASDFTYALSIRGIKLAKLTQGLFWLNPQTFYPVDSHKAYLGEEMLSSPIDTYNDYMAVIERVKLHFEKPLYEVSHDAWTHSRQNQADKAEEVNFWIFQCNPAYFDLIDALAQNKLYDWSVAAHRDKMRPGDKVLIYMTGKQAGVYALAELTSVPYLRSADSANNWQRAEEFDYKVAIHVTHDISSNPITKQLIATIPELSSFKGGNQGTNFTSSQAEYDIVMNMVQERNSVHIWLYAPGENANRWDEFYADSKMAIAWNRLGDLRQYSSQNEVEQTLATTNPKDRRQYNNARACFEFASVLKQGDIVIAKRGSSEYVGWGVVVSDYMYDASITDYQHIRKVQWIARGSWPETVHRLVLKTLTDITKYPEYVERIVEQLGIDVNIKVPMHGSDRHVSQLQSLNTILFGPPGTGKTYNTVNKAIEIIDPEFAATDPSRDALKQRFDELINAEQICFTTFHQSMSYEDFIEGIKPTGTSVGGSIGYEIRDGVFKNFCERALSNWEASRLSTETQLSFEVAWTQFVQEWEDNQDMQIPTARKHYTIADIRSKSVVFRKLSGSTSHSLSINTLRDYYYEKRPVMQSGLGVYYPGLVAKLHSYRGKHEAIPLKNYVFIIDEINRGNVSQIFGELITLIEDSKRLGAPEQLTATLPYSTDQFGVPPNLYILGTMNTADRSVEALDTALRRRFSFAEMPPVYNLQELQRTVHGVVLADLVQTINRRIEKLLDRDHLIGHSYFLDTALDLQAVFQNKIIPLLQEYFFGDYGKIGLVLGRGFVEIVQNERGRSVFADFDYDESTDLADRLVYRLKLPMQMTPAEFQQALQLLMGS